MPPAVLPVYSGFEASGRRGRFVRPAGWIAERARDASTSATIRAPSADQDAPRTPNAGPDRACNPVQSSPDPVGIVHAAQVHDLVGLDLRAAGGQIEPHGDHVRVGAIAARSACATDAANLAVERAVLFHCFRLLFDRVW